MWSSERQARNPSEGDHHHVGPVGLERLERRVRGPNAALEMRVEVSLVAALAGLEDDVFLPIRSRRCATLRSLQPPLDFQPLCSQSSK